jgi:superfamily II DNA/RNA helicase
MQRLTSRLSMVLPLRASLALSRGINTAINSIYPDGPSFEYRQKNKMMITGGGFDPRREDLAPFLSLETAPFHPTIMEYLNTIGFKEPTTIQAQAWPIILSGRDAICVAKSGQGKTLGYLAPLFSNLLTEPLEGTAASNAAAPKVLILAHRRESALAVAQAVKPFAKMCNMKTAVMTGGYATEEDATYLKQKGASGVLVATPGRAAKLVRDGHLDVSQVKRIVLDEGHILLNPFQCTDTKTILKKLTKDDLQTVVVGGRWYQENRDNERQYMKGNRILLHVLRPKRDRSGEPTARAMKTAQPTKRRRMLKRWKGREELIRAAEVISLSPSV